MRRVNKVLRSMFRHKPDVKALSAHLDQQLAVSKAAWLDAHLTVCAECRAVLAGFRDARAALRTLSVAEPPRSFRLRAADVEAPAPRATEALPRGLRWAPAA